MRLGSGSMIANRQDLIRSLAVTLSHFTMMLGVVESSITNDTYLRLLVHIITLIYATTVFTWLQFSSEVLHRRPMLADA